VSCDEGLSHALLERARQLTGDGRLDAGSDLVRAGLDSLGAMVLAGFLAEHGHAHVSAAQVLSARTVTALLDLAAGAATASSGGGDDDGAVPAAQLAIWLDDQLRDPADVANVLMAVFEFTGSPDPERLARSLRSVADSQAALRTALVPDAWGAPTTESLPTDEAVEITVGNALEAADLSEQLALTAHRVDAEMGPLVVAEIHPGDPSYLILCAHHCVMDGNGLAILVDQASAAYRGATLPAARPYVEFAAESRARVQQAVDDPDAAAWMRDLTSTEDLTWPAAHGEPGTLTTHLEIEALTADALPRAAAAAGVTPFVVALAAYSLALSEVCGQSRFTVGVPMSAQSAAFARTIGSFVTCTPVVVDLGRPAGDLLPALQHEVRRAMAHQDLGLVELVRRARPQRGAMRPLVQAQFSWPDFEQPSWDLPGVVGTELPPPIVDAQFDLTLEIQPQRSSGLPWPALLECEPATLTAQAVSDVGTRFLRHLAALVT